MLEFADIPYRGCPPDALPFPLGTCYEAANKQVLTDFYTKQEIWTEGLYPELYALCLIGIFAGFRALAWLLLSYKGRYLY